MSRRAVILLIGLAMTVVDLGFLAAWELPVPAAASPAVDCAAGVIVAADFSTWGGAVNTVCVPTLPANGVDVLQEAGFKPTGVAGFGLAFVCQIGGDPPNDPCTSTPPADAYWSFWYANAGRNTWTYSQLGAMSLVPSAGSVEAWVFGGAAPNSRPSFPSPDVIRTSTTDTPPPPPTTVSTAPRTTSTTVSAAPTTSTVPVPLTAGGSPIGSTAKGAGDQGESGAANASPSSGTSAATGSGQHQTSNAGATGSSRSKGSSASVSPGSPRPRPTSKPANATGGTPSSPKIIDAAPVVAGEHPSGSPLPLVIGAVAVVALAGSGVLIGRRRRRAD